MTKEVAFLRLDVLPRFALSAQRLPVQLLPAVHTPLAVADSRCCPIRETNRTCCPVGPIPTPGATAKMSLPTSERLGTAVGVLTCRGIVSNPNFARVVWHVSMTISKRRGAPASAKGKIVVHHTACSPAKAVSGPIILLYEHVINASATTKLNVGPQDYRIILEPVQKPWKEQVPRCAVHPVKTH